MKNQAYLTECMLLTEMESIQGEEDLGRKTRNSVLATLSFRQHWAIQAATSGKQSEGESWVLLE